MARGILLVFSDPTSPEQDAEYNQWYSEVHLKEVVGVEGIVGASRFRRLMPADTGIPAEQYLAVYELEGDDLSKVGPALMAAAPNFNMSPAIQLNPAPSMIWYSEITPRVSQ